MARRYDVFLSHASEDKGRFVDDLVQGLRARGKTVWYDTNEIKPGDDFRTKMDAGLSTSNYGVVILSPNFFKYWPEAELSALFAMEGLTGQKKILPVLLDMSAPTLALQSPLLAARNAVSAHKGLQAVLDAICAVLDDTPSVVGQATRTLVYGARRLPSTAFTGRDDKLQELEQLLVQDSQDVRVSATIQGLAGVGKTELAIHLVDRLAAAGAFPGGLYWLEAEAPDLTNQWGSTIADQKGLKPHPNVEARAQAVLNALSRTNRPLLVVLDNVESWAGTSQPHPLPEGPHVRLLVTTRQHRLGGARFKHVDLPTLRPEAARHLLEETSGRKPIQDAENLLRHLDGHALSLELAGNYLRWSRRTSPDDYLEQLRTERLNRNIQKQVQGALAYQGTVDTALATTYAALPPYAQEAWRIASQFEDAPATYALAEACGLKEEATAALEAYSVVREEDDGRWTMHRLVRDFGLRAGTSAELDAAEQRFYAGCVTRAKGMDQFYGQRIYLPDAPHYDAAASAALRHPNGFGEGRTAFAFVRSVELALGSAARFRDRRRLLETLLEAEIQACGNDSPEVAKTRNNLGLVLKDLGQLSQAKGFLEKALHAIIKAYGEDHPQVARTRGNLGVVHYKLDELSQAKELFEKALQTNINAYGEDHPEVAIDRNNVGTVLQDLGERTQAKELFEKALQANINAYGEDHPEVARNRNNLGLLLHDLGERTQAKELYEKALQAEINAYGEDHPEVALTRRNLANLMRQLDPSKP